MGFRQLQEFVNI